MHTNKKLNYLTSIAELLSFGIRISWNRFCCYHHNRFIDFQLCNFKIFSIPNHWQWEGLPLSVITNTICFCLIYIHVGFCHFSHLISLIFLKASKNWLFLHFKKLALWENFCFLAFWALHLACHTEANWCS